jgi:heme/copper-type cytochrome/quinol oxidase subunit 3
MSENHVMLRVRDLYSRSRRQVTAVIDVFTFLFRVCQLFARLFFTFHTTMSSERLKPPPPCTKHHLHMQIARKVKKETKLLE